MHVGPQMKPGTIKALQQLCDALIAQAPQLGKQERPEPGIIATAQAADRLKRVLDEEKPDDRQELRRIQTDE